MFWIPCVKWSLNFGSTNHAWCTPGETENEWQKTKPVPIPLLRGARSFFDAKKMKKKMLAWTSEIIQFIRYSVQMDRTKRSNFLGEKVDFLYLSNFAIVGYGHFPTRNGLKLIKLSTFTSLRINNSLRLFILRLVSSW